MWLAIYRENEISSFWNCDHDKVKVEVFESLNDKLVNSNGFKRLSQLFELDKDNSVLPSFINNTYIRFCFFQKPMKALGQLRKIMENYDVRIYFGYGLSSVVIFSKNSENVEELINNISEKFISYEEWEIENHYLKKAKVPPINEVNSFQVGLNDYSKLPKSIKSIFEELHLLLNIFSSKVALIPQEGLFSVNKIYLEVNSLIEKIIEYQTYIRTKGVTIKDIKEIVDLNKVGLNKLEQGVNEKIKYIYYNDQYVDRAIQLVSILSYVTTQAFSGIIPILSRRSLLRRHSLLGIGACVLALNKATVFIEDIFHNYNFTEKITIDFKKENTFLPDIKNPHKYNNHSWKYYNIDKYTRKQNEQNNQFKLPYFSARLGFRESEYAVSAAIQSITNGVDREWSILTITHELMHSQVRKILNLILAGDLSEKNDDDKKRFYRIFDQISTSGFKPEHTLLDSIRYIIITHCCLADKYGSLTVIGESLVSGNELQDYNIPKDHISMFKLLMYNYRNINEVFVHLFDLYYIYRGQIEFYLMAIWHSWSSLPNINADLRQYILRSLIVTSSKVVSNEPHDKFKESASILKNAMVLLHEEVKKPLIAKIIILLNDFDELSKNYYSAFYSHLMLVDMISKVFISDEISGKLYEDDFVRIVYDNLKEELDFKYELQDDFENVSIDSPVAFLLDRIQRINTYDNIEYSRETCKAFLSII